MHKILIVLSAADTWTRTDGSKYDSGVWAGELVDIHGKSSKPAVRSTSPRLRGRSRRSTPTASTRKSPGLTWSATARTSTLSPAPSRPRSCSPTSTPSATTRWSSPAATGLSRICTRIPTWAAVLVAADGADKIIAAVCHGPAALLSATDPDGTWLFAGLRMTAFSDAEEVEFGTAENAPWLLATRLRESGAQYERGPVSWEPYVVGDGRLISGQNPASSGPVADAVLAALG